MMIRMTWIFRSEFRRSIDLKMSKSEDARVKLIYKIRELDNTLWDMQQAYKYGVMYVFTNPMEGIRMKEEILRDHLVIAKQRAEFLEVYKRDYPYSDETPDTYSYSFYPDFD